MTEGVPEDMRSNRSQEGVAGEAGAESTERGAMCRGKETSKCVCSTVVFLVGTWGSAIISAPRFFFLPPLVFLPLPHLLLPVSPFLLLPPPFSSLYFLLPLLPRQRMLESKIPFLLML
ncbi:hypothetical protein F5X68DRAFT_16760 [Plectosphaerella plurivora]|uniref:Uncharacterized protein n=1 Tax=Plectosphaerella plurivora TaxID=936078 RepID=A0A9P8VAL5_9PEZI|nr:hypothetical protein F5X68DRAFT_16760 [Plectosphaerella plurivora]